MTKLHVVRKRLSIGDRWYVYAWRGGPCIHTAEGRKPVITPDILAKQAAERAKIGSDGGNTFETIIGAYRDSPEFDRLRDSTKRDYRLWLNRISERFGTSPIGAFEDRRMRGVILQWRNQWAGQPRSADKASVMMATLLAWAVESTLLSVNVAAKIKQLHSVDKSAQVWERRHMRQMTKAPKQLRNALKLAGLTGLRLGDLVRLEWSQVGAAAIIVERTRKRGGRAVIPILPETRKLLSKLGKQEGAVLKNSRGAPWTESGLGSVFQKAKPKGFDRTMHDLRGTFATRLILAGLTDQEAALILGWTAKQIASIRARYVNEERVIIDLAERLSA